MMKLRQLSDRELLAELTVLRKDEQKATHKILLHLIEVERRKLHLSEGYASLFEYCTRGLGYCESGANRRVRTARGIRDFPEVYHLLESGQVNLSTVSLVARILTSENKIELLGEISGKSFREVEVIASRYRPGKPIPERVTPVAVAAMPVASQGLTLALMKLSGTPAGGVLVSPAGPHAPRTEGCKRSYRLQGGQKLTSDKPAAIIQRFKLSFGVSDDFMKKLDEIKILLSNTCGPGTALEQVFETLMDEYLSRHSPKKKMERREQRMQKRAARRARAPRPSVCGIPARSVDELQQPRHIPVASRDKVFARDRGRCRYVGPNGRRCGATHNLHIDHIVPLGCGGATTPDNLRLLCANHNRLEAERIYGREFMARFDGRATAG